MGTPRPSISPLSNAYESTKGSPSLLRTGAMADESGQIDVAEHMTYNDDDDDGDKDDSSLLSEPIDDDKEDEVLAAINVDRKVLQRDEVDSEAETERLEYTPKHSREAVEPSIGRTPSKLSRVEPQDDPLSEPPSPLPHDVGAASSTSTVALGGKKRKRSDTLESPLSSEASVSGEPPRKRSNSLQEGALIEETVELAEDASAEATARSGKGRKGKTRRSGRLERDTEAADTIEAEDDAIEQEIEDPPEPHADEEDPVQNSEATNAFTLLAKQFTAFRDALLNERLASIDAEIALLEQPQCQHPEYVRMIACVQRRRVKQDQETKAFHQYRQVATQQKVLAERSQLHSQYFQTARELREEALDTLGASWHAIQRERRQGTSVEDDNRHVYRYVDKRSDLLRQQAKYNREVSILSGVAKYVGFPAAPEITGIEGDGLDDDLKAMKLARPVQQQQLHTQSHQNPRPYQPRNSTPHVATSYLPRQTGPTAASAERSAHDKFIEQHAWARAPQSVNHLTLTSTPNISHTPEWAEHASGFRKTTAGGGGGGSGIGPMRNHHDHNPADRITPSSTPLNGRPGQGLGHDIPDSSEHIGRDFAQPQSSPLLVPKQRMNGTESNGWRDYSGTSTIDAPLGDSSQDHDGYRSVEHSSSIKRDFAREQLPDTRTNLPPFGGNASQAYEERKPQIPQSLFGNDKPEAFNTAGFRPLEGSFIAPAGRSIGGT